MFAIARLYRNRLLLLLLLLRVTAAVLFYVRRSIIRRIKLRCNPSVSLYPGEDKDAAFPFKLIAQTNP